MRLIFHNLRSQSDRIVLISVMQNAQIYLPFFTAYYRRLGVTDFVFIDNASTDKTSQMLRALNVPKAIYQCSGSYRAANYGMDWVQEALETHCRDTWCVVVDADELLVYDGCEQVRLAKFVSRLEQRGCNALYAYLIDMYRGSPGEYQPGTSFVSFCPYFDRLNSRYYSLPHGANILHGGMRARLTGVDCCLGKFPLFKWTMRSVRLDWGCHFWRDTNGRRVRSAAEVRPDRRRGALLHFKFLEPQLESLIRKQISAGEHWNNCSEYRAYEAAEIWNAEFFDEKFSRRFHSSGDLREFFDFEALPSIDEQH